MSESDDTLLAWEPQPGRQPNATVDEWHECDEAMRRHPDVIAALAERGIDDPSLTLIDVWTYGATLIPEPFAGRRIGWCDVWLRGAPGGNPYAHPVSGLKLVVDMNTMDLLEIQDGPDPGLPDVMGEYTPAHVPGYAARTTLRPLQVVQPEGASFTLDGHACCTRWGGPKNQAPTVRAPTVRVSGRSRTGSRSPRWWCPTATPRRTTSTAPRSTSASGAWAS